MQTIRIGHAKTIVSIQKHMRKKVAIVTYPHEPSRLMVNYGHGRPRK
jgi:hypothetical protein